MSYIKNRLKQYKDKYSKYSKHDGLYVEDVLDMLEQLQEDLERDERPKLTKIEKSFIESLDDKWTYLRRSSNGQLEAVRRTFSMYSINSESLKLEGITKAKFGFITDDSKEWSISDLKECEVEA